MQLRHPLESILISTMVIRKVRRRCGVNKFQLKFKDNCRQEHKEVIRSATHGKLQRIWTGFIMPLKLLLKMDSIRKTLEITNV